MGLQAFDSDIGEGTVDRSWEKEINSWLAAAASQAWDWVMRRETDNSISGETSLVMWLQNEIHAEASSSS